MGTSLDPSCIICAGMMKVHTRQKEVQAVYTDKEVTRRLTNLVLSMFTDPKKPWANWANLSCKGGEGKHLAPCLLEVLKNILDFSKPEHSHMLKCLEHVCQVVAIWDSAGTFLTKAEFKKSWQLAQDAMKEYQWLNAWSEACGRSSFHIVIKHHTFLHLAKDAWYFNPRVFWCFKAEDYVGHISTVTHSVSMGVKATKISQKPGHQVQNCITSSVHKARVSSANLG